MYQKLGWGHAISCLLFWGLFKDLFTYLFERETAGRRGQGGERKHPKYTPGWVWRPMRGSISQPWDHDLSQNQESDAEPTIPPRHPSCLLFCNKFLSIWKWQPLITLVSEDQKPWIGIARWFCLRVPHRVQWICWQGLESTQAVVRKFFWTPHVRFHVTCLLIKQLASPKLTDPREDPHRNSSLFIPYSQKWHPSFLQYSIY